MSSGTATVTADYGPGLTATAKVISGIKTFVVDIEKQVLSFRLSNDDVTSPQLEYDLSGVTTFTATLSGAAGNWTITVS